MLQPPDSLNSITDPRQLQALVRLELAAHLHSPWTAEMMRQELAHADAGIWGILDPETGDLGAMLIFRDQCDEVQILDVAVHPEARRRGWARRLVGALVQQAEAAGRLSITLEVRASNGAAIALYEGCGFVQVGRRPRYYTNPPEDALVMSHGDAL